MLQLRILCCKACGRVKHARWVQLVDPMLSCRQSTCWESGTGKHFSLPDYLHSSFYFATHSLQNRGAVFTFHPSCLSLTTAHAEVQSATCALFPRSCCPSSFLHPPQSSLGGEGPVAPGDPVYIQTFWKGRLESGAQSSREWQMNKMNVSSVSKIIIMVILLFTTSPDSRILQGCSTAVIVCF